MSRVAVIWTVGGDVEIIYHLQSIWWEVSEFVSMSTLAVHSRPTDEQTCTEVNLCAALGIETWSLLVGGYAAFQLKVSFFEWLNYDFLLHERSSAFLIRVKLTEANAAATLRDDDNGRRSGVYDFIGEVHKNAAHASQAAQSCSGPVLRHYVRHGGAQCPSQSPTLEAKKAGVWGWESALWVLMQDVPNSASLCACSLCFTVWLC